MDHCLIVVAAAAGTEGKTVVVSVVVAVVYCTGTTADRRSHLETEMGWFVLVVIAVGGFVVLASLPVGLAPVCCSCQCMYFHEWVPCYER